MANITFFSESQMKALMKLGYTKDEILEAWEYGKKHPAKRVTLEEMRELGIDVLDLIIDRRSRISFLLPLYTSANEIARLK